MDNKTSSICLLNKNGIDVIIWKIGAFLFPVLGIPGHVVLILTTCCSNRRRSQPTSLYFISISTVEIVHLLFIFWDWLDIVDLVEDPRKMLNCAFFYPFVSGTGFISILLLVQLNLDRICIIHKPQQIYLHITHRRILIKILLTFSSILLFVFHFYFSVYYDEKSFGIFGQSCQVYEYAQIWFYFIWPYIQILCRLTPCLLLIYCTIYIFYKRCSSTKAYLHRQEQKYSLVLIFLSIYTFLSIIPITTLQIFNQYMWKYELECYCLNCRNNNNNHKEQWKLLNAIFIMWETSIYMIKFYIKFLFSSQFRFDVKHLICYQINNNHN